MTQPDTNERLALDTSVMDKARAMHRVWRALNDGDCPKCHRMHAATDMNRKSCDDLGELGIQCPSCGFRITYDEIEAIEKMFAPAMNAAVAIFEEWRKSR